MLATLFKLNIFNMKFVVLKVHFVSSVCKHRARACRPCCSAVGVDVVSHRRRGVLGAAVAAFVAFPATRATAAVSPATIDLSLTPSAEARYTFFAHITVASPPPASRVRRWTLHPSAQTWSGDGDAVLSEVRRQFQLALNASDVAEEERLWTDLIRRLSASDAPWAPPLLGQVHGNRGNARSRQGALEAALADYETAIRLAPWAVDPVLNRGVVLEQLGRYPEAVADYRAVLQAAPADPAAYNNLGNAEMGMGAYADAAEHYSRAASLAPQFSFGARRPGARAVTGPAPPARAAGLFGGRGALGEATPRGSERKLGHRPVCGRPPGGGGDPVAQAAASVSGLHGWCDLGFVKASPGCCRVQPSTPAGGKGHRLKAPLPPAASQCARRWRRRSGPPGSRAPQRRSGREWTTRATATSPGWAAPASGRRRWSPPWWLSSSLRTLCRSNSSSCCRCAVFACGRWWRPPPPRLRSAHATAIVSTATTTTTIVVEEEERLLRMIDVTIDDRRGRHSRARAATRRGR